MVKLRKIKGSKDVEKVKGRVLEVIEELHRKYAMVMSDDSGKYRKFRRMTDVKLYEMAIGYSIVDFLLVRCRCGHYDVDVKVGVPEIEDGLVVNIFHVKCKQCGVKKGEILASAGMAASVIMVPQKKGAFVLVHTTGESELMCENELVSYIADDACELLTSIIEKRRK